MQQRMIVTLANGEQFKFPRGPSCLNCGMQACPACAAHGPSSYGVDTLTSCDAQAALIAGIQTTCPDYCVYRPGELEEWALAFLEACEGQDIKQTVDMNACDEQYNGCEFANGYCIYCNEAAERPQDYWETPPDTFPQRGPSDL